MDIKFIRQNIKKTKDGCRKKNINIDIDKILELDEKKRKILIELEKIRSQQNKINGKPDAKEIEKLRIIKKNAKDLEKKLKVINNDLNRLISLVPNLPLDSVPIGKDEKENSVLREIGEKRKFLFKPKDYLTIAENLDLIDVERAAKVSGSRFGYLKSSLVLLQLAIIQYTIEFLSKEKNIKKIINEKKLDLDANPFIPVLPPVMVKEESMRAMGYMDRTADEIYHLQKDNLYLVGTAEQSIGPMHKNETFTLKQLPLRYVGFSTCFRREAGSYGKDVRGIIRVHQFDKLEMFIFCQPKNSRKEHQLLLGCEESLMQGLKIPYQVINICTGDLGDPAAAKYDIEAWMPGQNQYRETHSTSNCTDFQSQRLNIRFRDKDGKIKFVYTLNGTAFALGRIIIAIIENYQQKDGSIKIPKILQKYVGQKIIKKK